MTLVEVLIVVALAAIVLAPVTGIAYLVLRRSKPNQESAEASKQLRMFRTVLADDWASASEIVINPQPHPGAPAGYTEEIANCGGLGYGGGAIRIALTTSYRVSGWPPSSPQSRSTPLRILYREVQKPDGTIQVNRQVCRHKINQINDDFSVAGDPGGVDPSVWRPTWRTGGRTDEQWAQTDAPGSPLFSIGKDQVLLDSVRALVLPPDGAPPTGHGCNTTPVAPFVPCDMNVTVIGVDGDRQKPFDPNNPYSSTAQRSTLRLHQMVGPVS